MKLMVATLVKVSTVVAVANDQVPRIVRLDPLLDAVVPPTAKIEKIADRFTWTEGPVWNKAGGSLLFSDVAQNAIFKWHPKSGVTQFLSRSGYTGAERFSGREPGSNGLAFDPEGRLVICQHGDRRISRIEKDGSRTTLVDRYAGKRLNSPNDLVFKSNGDLYFTDPPFGLPQAFDDAGRELPFSGVYRLSPSGELTLLTSDLKGPNGIAFSPDEKTLYVSDAVETRLFAFEVHADGTLGARRLLFDASDLAKLARGSADGLKVDTAGNIFAAAPGGVCVLSPDGRLLGRIDLGGATGNCARGEHGSTLFITAGPNVYRMRLPVRGAGTHVAGFSVQPPSSSVVLAATRDD